MKDISYRGFTIASSGSHMLPVVIFHTHEGKGKAPPASDFFADVKEAKEAIDQRGAPCSYSWFPGDKG